jgi:MFS family permease
LLAAVLIGLLGDGPQLKRVPSAETAPRQGVLSVFRLPPFRASALGYFGHMWEQYAFWTLVPLLVAGAAYGGPGDWSGVSGLAFAIIAAGTLGSFAGGALSRRTGSVPVAAGALAVSGCCCLIFAAAAGMLPAWALLILLLVWGASVVADSPHFSALSAAACPPHLVGSALAIQNAIGFAISVVSIGLATAWFDRYGSHVAWLLLPGPILGLIGFGPLLKKSTRRN